MLQVRDTFRIKLKKEMPFRQMCYILPRVRYRWLHVEVVSQAFSRRRKTALLQRVEIVRRQKAPGVSDDINANTLGASSYLRSHV